MWIGNRPRKWHTKDQGSLRLQLVVEQVTGGYEAKDDRMKKLMQKVRDRLSAFQTWELVQISSNTNGLADTLARMGGRMENINDPKVTLLVKASKEKGTKLPKLMLERLLLGWTKSETYLEHGRLPTEIFEARRKRLAARFFVEGEYLFKKSFTLPALRCLTPRKLGEL
ncbi:UNVERIFIED_CONTAM: hypothetical protein Slati_2179300 [Sesamum latifolium]|uniref:RNase H type-1 domain-containing protein n=1 Tax=Sesamum latifolium TaxID=2727402 RepID=A0AAW2WX82_9LAMI